MGTLKVSNVSSTVLRVPVIYDTQTNVTANVAQVYGDWIPLGTDTYTSGNNATIDISSWNTTYDQIKIVFSEVTTDTALNELVYQLSFDNGDSFDITYRRINRRFNSAVSGGDNTSSATSTSGRLFTNAGNGSNHKYWGELILQRVEAGTDVFCFSTTCGYEENDNGWGWEWGLSTTTASNGTHITDVSFGRAVPIDGGIFKIYGRDQQRT